MAEDNVCKFAREHPVLCNKYTVFSCLFVSFLSPHCACSPKKLIQVFILLGIALHCPSPFHPSIYPSIHSTLPWLTVVSCREAVNNLSGRVVPLCPAAHFWLGTYLGNIWQSTCNPPTRSKRIVRSFRLSQVLIIHHRPI